MKDLLRKISTVSFIVSALAFIGFYLCPETVAFWQGVLWCAGLTFALVGWFCLIAVVCQEGFE